MNRKRNVPFDMKNDTYVGKATNGDFTTAYTSATTVTLSSLPTWVTSITSVDIIWVMVYDINWQIKSMYLPNDNHITVSSNVVTVPNASFISTDTFVVYTNIPRTVDVTLEASDIEIWAVEIKDWSSDNRVTVGSDWALKTRNNWNVTTDWVLVGTDIGTYSFDASAQEITISWMGSLSIWQIQKIVNVRRWVVIFSPDDEERTATMSSNTIYLAYDTSSMSDTDDLQIYVKYNNSEDYTNNVKKIIEQAPEHSRYTSALTLVTAQDLTASYADYGAVINMNWYTKLGMKVTYDVNDSDAVKLQVLWMVSATDSTPAEIDWVSEKTVFVSWDSDWQIIYEFTTNSVPYVQIQAKAWTVWATAGDLTIEIFKIY